MEQKIGQIKCAKFLGIVISGVLKWNDFIVQNENSLLKFCNNRLTALRLLAREIPRAQKKIPTHGLIVSKTTYCLSCFVNCPGYLKKRMQ